MFEINENGLLEEQRQLQEKYLHLSTEQKILDGKLQNLASLTQQLDLDHLPFKSNVPIDTVKLFVTSLSNHFMIEIAQVFARGFSQNKVETKLLIDEIPSLIPKPGLLQIIVAPHEFYPLFLELKITDPEILKKITQNVYLLNVEQPGSIWFEIAYRVSQNAKGIFDINQQGVNELKKRNLTALHTPLGYESYNFGLNEEFDDSLKTIDLVFLGAYTSKREQFISRNASFFNQYNSSIIISRAERPNRQKTLGFYTGVSRNQLLQSSKILINVHAADRTYFEWHRVLLAIGHYCLVVSEDSEYIEPLVEGEHLRLAKVNELPELCEHYLKHPEERLKIINQAYDFVNTNYSIYQTCLIILEQFV